MRLGSDILIESALTHIHALRLTHTHTQHAHSHKFGTEELSSVRFFWLYRKRTCLPLHPTPQQRERGGMDSLLLLPPFPGLFYDVCQRQHRLQKVFRAGPKLSEVQQPSGKRSGHCGWSGRRMMASPPISHLPVPTSNLSVSPVRRSVLLVRCLLLVFGFPRPALPQGVSRTAAFEWRSLHIQYIYIHIHICVYLYPCLFSRPLSDLKIVKLPQLLCVQEQQSSGSL